jgi:predicted component of type VI protein secretion system
MTLTRVFENQIVVDSTEEYIKKDLPNILDLLKRECEAKAEEAGEAVKIVCDLGLKKFEGRVLRRLLVKEIKRAIKEVLNIVYHNRLNSMAY